MFHSEKGGALDWIFGFVKITFDLKYSLHPYP